MKHYVALSCTADRPSLERILAMSTLLPVTGTVDEGTRAVLYFDEVDLTDEVAESVADWLPENAIITRERIEEQNWNAQFEESLEPVQVAPGLVITQSWHPVVSASDVVITIDPKMSFGTGHHESTRLIARLMIDADFASKRVLDVGTGTGVLAILAAMRGAEYVLAFDNNEWATGNAVENVRANHVEETIEVRSCELEQIEPGRYDHVLANLHLNLIARLMPELVERLTPSEDSSIFTSGVLIEDYDWLARVASDHGLHAVAEERENEWVATRWTR